MNLKRQQEILNLHKRYNSNRSSIKANLKQCLDNTPLKYTIIAEQTGISVRTIYQIRNIGVDYIPDMYNTMLICDALGVSITDIMK